MEQSSTLQKLRLALTCTPNICRHQLLVSIHGDHWFKSQLKRGDGFDTLPLDTVFRVFVEVEFTNDTMQRTVLSQVAKCLWANKREVLCLEDLFTRLVDAAASTDGGSSYLRQHIMAATTVTSSTSHECILGHLMRPHHLHFAQRIVRLTGVDLFSREFVGPTFPALLDSHPMQWAARWAQSAPAVEWLLALRGADPNATFDVAGGHSFMCGINLLQVAFCGGSNCAAVVGCLLKHGSRWPNESTTTRPRTPKCIHWVRNQDAPAVEQLVQRTRGATFYVISRIELAPELFSAFALGANPKARSSKGSSLFSAAGHNNLWSVLYNLGVNPHATSPPGPYDPRRRRPPRVLKSAISLVESAEEGVQLFFYSHQLSSDEWIL